MRVTMGKAERNDKAPRVAKYITIQNRERGRRASQTETATVIAATIHLKDRCFVAYTLSRGGKLGMVLCSNCLTFCIVNGGYRALRTNSILEAEEWDHLFEYYESGNGPYQFGTLMVARK